MNKFIYFKKVNKLVQQWKISIKYPKNYNKIIMKRRKKKNDKMNKVNKLLSVLGAATLTASTAGALSTVTTITNNANVNYETNLNQKLITNYNALSSNDKDQVNNELFELSKLSLDQINPFLESSKNSFIIEHQKAIANVFASYNNMLMVQSLTTTVLDSTLNVDWLALNNIIDLGFGYSNNDYMPTVETYGPTSWTKFWEYGMKINFTEGDLNVMRVVNLLFTLYDGTNFQKLENILKIGKNLFDFLTNLNNHLDDTIGMFTSLLIDTRDIFITSGVPISQSLLDIIDSIVRVLRFLPNQKIGPYIKILKNLVEPKIGTTFEELGQTYLSYFENGIKAIETTNYVLAKIEQYLPGLISQYIFGTLESISQQMVNADKNKKGVALIIEQFINPTGFNAL